MFPIDRAMTNMSRNLQWQWPAVGAAHVLVVLTVPCGHCLVDYTSTQAFLYITLSGRTRMGNMFSTTSKIANATMPYSMKHCTV